MLGRVTGVFPGLTQLSDAQARWALTGALIAHIAAWTIYGTIALGFGGIHGDMGEAYAWGQELQLGYDKHPPFWAWLTFAWFEIFPRENWSFYLLASLNAAAGLWGTWVLAGQFLRPHQRLAVVLLLMLSPCYSVMALKLNANTILLSLWPWATYFFVRSAQDPKRHRWPAARPVRGRRHALQVLYAAAARGVRRVGVAF